MKSRKFGKTRKDTRWKRGEIVVVEGVRKQSESEDGGMRELRERFEVVEVGKHSRGPGEPGMQPRDPCLPWRGKLGPGHTLR